MGDQQEGFVKICDRNIWYRVEGMNKPGVPLLIIHGGPGFPHDYLVNLQALADERPVIWYDQLGCGNSEKPGDTNSYNLDYYTSELATIRRLLELPKVHILGQSWGTMLAVEYYLSHKPDGIQSFILSSPCLSVSRWHADQRRNIANLPEIHKNAILLGEEAGNCNTPEYQDAMMFFYQQHVCRMDPWPPCLEESMKKLGHEVYEFMWGQSEFTITGTLQTYERGIDVGIIPLPILFTCGRFDESSPDSTAWYHQNTPGSTLVVFEDASHSHHLEQEAAYIHSVRKFLSSVSEQKNGCT